MIMTCSQLNRTDKYSQHSSIIWPVWLNGWVFIYERGDCGFEYVRNNKLVAVKNKPDATFQTAA